jgi:hypothetical protein
MRRLFEGDALTVADRIGKWVCLLERWPALAQALIRQPRAIIELEQSAHAADATQLRTLLQELAPGHAADTELHALLRRQPPFGSDLESLIRFEADVAPDRSRDRQVSGIVPKVTTDVGRGRSSG